MDLMRLILSKGRMAVAEQLGRRGEGPVLPAAAPQAGTKPEPVAGRYDRAVDALNRLPRPLLALGAVGLFGFAMLDPAGFARRMAGLAAMPEPLWWLVGGIVSFHFGARETHYRRGTAAAAVGAGASSLAPADPAPTRPATGGVPPAT